MSAPCDTGSEPDQLLLSATAAEVLTVVIGVWRAGARTR